jgi:hypothetical protein
MEIFLTSFSDLKMVNGKPDTQENYMRSKNNFCLIFIQLIFIFRSLIGFGKGLHNNKYNDLESKS